MKKQGRTPQIILSTGSLKSILVLLFFITSLSFSALSQGINKQEAEIAKLRTSVDRAYLAHKKLEQKMAMADSLIEIGTTMREESSQEIKAATSEMKAKNKTYTSEKKVLAKKLKSKNKVDIAEAKAEIKTVDAAYKAEVKAYDAIMKAQTKKSTDGTKNLEKGKTIKKDSGKALKEASKTLTNAQYALEDATDAVGDETPAKGKKGKKK